jgi:MOSC domain-containing protein YiiM
MQLMSVNIGTARTQPNGDKLETTGIYKLPTLEPARITALGVESDFVCDQKYHGGPDQAVYIYGAPDYAWWSRELRQELEAGTFGENLTISGLESAQCSIGDRLHIGAVILEVAAPRMPCSTLAARMRDPMFVRKYRRAERPGLYCRVVQEGTLQVSEGVGLESYAGDRVTALEVFRNHYVRAKDGATLRRILASPIAVRVRLDLERELKKQLERA